MKGKFGYKEYASSSSIEKVILSSTTGSNGTQSKSSHWRSINKIAGQKQLLNLQRSLLPVSKFDKVILWVVGYTSR